jgi:type III pantothenate kinase
MIEGIIGKISEEIGGKATVVATGGFARMISDETGVIDVVDENLLLEGLNLLFKRLYTDAEQ